MSTGMKTVLVIVAAAAALAITVFAVTERRGFSALFLNALGGMAASGILGMFIGATLLSIGYRIFMSWVNDGQVGDSQTPVVPDDKDAQ